MNSEPVPPPADTECGYGGVCKRAGDKRVQIDFAGTRYVGFACKRHAARVQIELRAQLEKGLRDGNLP